MKVGDVDRLPAVSRRRWRPLVEGAYGALTGALAIHVLINDPDIIEVVLAAPVVVLAVAGVVWAVWTMPADARRLRGLDAMVRGLPTHNNVEVYGGGRRTQTYRSDAMVDTALAYALGADPRLPRSMLLGQVSELVEGRGGQGE